MSEWFPATVAESARGRSTLLELALNVPHELAMAFQRPGQYHRVRIDEDDNPFAIASAPGHARFEYLVRRAPGLAERWVAFEAGAKVLVSRPHGPGFPLAEARGRSLGLVATGTGFAPIRSVLGAVADQRDAYGAVHALVGVRSELDLAWEREVAEWAEQGIAVHHVISSPGSGWAGRVGHVQQHLEVLPVGGVAFLCGQPEMVTEVRELLGKNGFSADRVFLNLPA